MWNWETGAWHSELRTCREARYRVAYRDGGAEPRHRGLGRSSDESVGEPDQALLIAPSPAGESDDRGWLYGRRYGANEIDVDTRLENLPVVARAAIGLTEQADHQAALEAARVRLGIAPRPMAWDLAWLADGRPAIALDDGTLELWRPATGEVARVRPPIDALPGFVSAQMVSLHRLRRCDRPARRPRGSCARARPTTRGAARARCCTRSRAPSAAPTRSSRCTRSRTATRSRWTRAAASSRAA